MDSYKVLHVSEDASDEEIYKSYISLLSNYDSDYNTSPYARRKQREIEKAYRSIQNELKRSLYKESKSVSEPIKIDKELFDYDSYRKEEKEDVYVPIPLKSVNSYDGVEASILEKNIESITLDVDYRYYVLGCKFPLKYRIKKECKHSISTRVICSCCNSITKVNYLNSVIYCPTCDAAGYVNEHKCDFCNDTGYVFEETIEDIIINDDILDNGIMKGDVIYKFNIVNKEKVVEEKNNIFVYYDLSYDESLNGLNLRWETKYGDIVINSKKAINKEYVFDFEKKVKIVVNKVAYKGTDVKKYLFVRPFDVGQVVYLDTNTFKYNDSLLGAYNVKILITDYQDIIVSGYGDEGVNGGPRGDLILTPIVTSSKVNVENVEEYRIVRKKTSAMFNLFGGKLENLYSFGFKSKNATLIDRKNKVIYVLSGDDKVKRRVSSYFVLSLFIYLIWLVMPLLIVILPYTKTDLIVSCVCTIIYSILANIMLNLKL